MAKKEIKIPKKIKELLRKLEFHLGTNEFYLCGGTLIDFLLGKELQYKDIDIIIKGKDLKKISSIKKALKKNGYAITLDRREYLIYNKEKVIIIMANNGKFYLDLVFMDNQDSIGQFNFRTIYCSNKGFKCVDKFNSIESIRKRKLICVRGLNKENPYILLTIFLYICSKYDVSMVDNQKTINILLKRISMWRDTNYFHKNTRASFISNFLKSLVTSKNKKKYLDNLRKTKILKIAFPEIDYNYDKLFKTRQFSHSLNSIKNKKQLINLFMKNLNTEDKKSFIKRVLILKKRKWNKEDSKIFMN